MRFFWLFVCGLFLVGRASAQQNGYVLDYAHLLRSETVQQLDGICSHTASSTGAPIVVVTITSLSGVGSNGTIESYAYDLFNTWRLGSARNNRAALLVVSRDDRRARIELGADWGSGKNEASQTIMDNTIVPRFKQGDYDGGIVQGVWALDDMIRSGKMPHAHTEIVFWLVFCGAVLLVFILWFRAPLFGRGGLYSSGYDYYGPSSNSGFLGGGGGGGGGFSSGGGASGSW